MCTTISLILAHHLLLLLTIWSLAHKFRIINRLLPIIMELKQMIIALI